MALTRNDSAPLFTADAANTLRLIGYLAVAIALMVADHRGAYLTRLRYSLSAVVEPMYRLAALPAQVARESRLALADRERLTEANNKLSQDLLLAQAQLNRLTEVREQNQRLQELLAVQRSLNLDVQLARIVDVDTDPFRHRLVIGAGTNQSVRVGEAVLDAHGVMGQIVETLPNTSTVMLITDASHALPVAVERTGMRAIARGDKEAGMLSLPNIPISADLKVGDRLLTSGLGGHFPAGFPVGTVRTIGNDASGMFAVATVTPSALLDRSGEVLVLHQIVDPVGPPAPTPTNGPPAALATEAPGKAKP
jgi:rod shape-determining protein MreC